MSVNKKTDSLAMKPLINILAAIEITLSPDHVDYVIKVPKMVDWFAFVGGISVLCFLLGKTINQIFMRDPHIGPMMEKLFEVQDVSKLNNIRLKHFCCFHMQIGNTSR